MNKKQLKVAIYCRLSEEDKDKKCEEDDSESITNQKSLLTGYAIAQGWDIYGIFCDEDFPGADRNRPDFNRLLALAEQRAFDIVLCKTQSRFTRELELVEKYINGLFLEWGIRFVSIVDNADTEIKGNKISRQINGLVDELYIENMSDNIKIVLTNKRENGQYIGSVPKYGYLKDPNQKGHLIIDPVAAEVVKEVFSLYNQGYGKTAIARMLNEKGVPNPTQYKVEQGIRYKTPKNKTGTYWKYYAISDMLSNEMYIGNMVQGKYGSISFKSKKNKPRPKEKWIRVENTHEPIIDMDLWNSVQSKINDNFKPYTGGKIGLFAKKCKCMHCNYTMKSSKSHGDRYLRCSTKHVAKDTCIGSFISEKTLAKTVLNELNILINQYLNVNELEKNVILQQFSNKKEKLQEEIIKYQSRANEYSKALKDLYMDKSKGIITEEDFVTLTMDLQKDRDNVTALLEERKSKLLELKDEQDILKSKRQILEPYINVKELTREMVDTLIDYIVVGRRNQDTRELPIEIHWKI